MSDWIPDLPNDSRPIYEQLIAALQRDIRSGRLKPGTRLPPQRDLAQALSIGVGTVTKAYAEAQHRGLVKGFLGRGTFVVGKLPESSSTIDGRAQSGAINLFHNLSPLRPASVHIAEALSKLRRRPDLHDHLGYSSTFGFEAHRRAAAGWLKRTASLEGIDPSRIVITAGAQQAMLLALSVLAKRGDSLLCEAGTFHGMKALAAHAGYNLIGLAMDSEGLLPDALDSAAASTGAKVLYTIPTLQNPTGRMMSETRRRQIARIAQRRNLWIVEDDVYAAYATSHLPLASYAPEHTFYVSSVSKTLAPGLRAGFLVPPEQHVDSVMRGILGMNYSPPSFGSAIATQWIEDGTADEIMSAVRTEVAMRTKLALRILGDAIEPLVGTHTLHVWLPMSELQAERVAGRALRSSVEVTPPAAPIVNGSLLTGLRLCIGGVADLATLERGLKVVRTALSSEVAERALAVV